jgi:hypothetical protein
LRRVIRANAARTASVLLRGFFAGAGTLGFPAVSPLAPGIIGSVCVGVDGPRSRGCIPIGPALSEFGFFLGMTDNAQGRYSFSRLGWTV